MFKLVEVVDWITSVVPTCSLYEVVFEEFMSQLNANKICNLIFILNLNQSSRTVIFIMVVVHSASHFKAITCYMPVFLSMYCIVPCTVIHVL